MILIRGMDDIAAHHGGAFLQGGKVGVQTGVVAVHDAGLAGAEHGAGGGFLHGQVVNGDQTFVVELFHEGQNVLVLRLVGAEVPLAVHLVLSSVYQTEGGGQLAVLQAVAQVGLALEHEGGLHAVLLHGHQGVIELVDGLGHIAADGVQDVLTVEQAAPVAVGRLLLEDVAGQVVHLAVQLGDLVHVDGLVDVGPVVGSVLLQHGGLDHLNHLVGDEAGHAAVVITAGVEHEHVGQGGGAVEGQHQGGGVSEFLQFHLDAGLLAPGLEAGGVHGGGVAAVGNAAVQLLPDGQGRGRFHGVGHFRQRRACAEDHTQGQKGCQNLFHAKDLLMVFF